MAGYYKKIFHDGYTTNPLETRQHSVELTGTQQSGPAGEHINLMMLDEEKRTRGERPISEMGLSLTLDQAESLANWLLEAVSDSRAASQT